MKVFRLLMKTEKKLGSSNLAQNVSEQVIFQNIIIFKMVFVLSATELNIKNLLNFFTDDWLQVNI